MNFVTDYPLTIYAGAHAHRHICENGLKPQHITRIIGASGASKWLTIAGLDAYIFGSWLADIDHDIDLFGTSVGAFKLAAAASANPRARLHQLAQDYAAFGNDDNSTNLRDAISQSTRTILHRLLGNGQPNEILSHPYLRFHCGTVKPIGGFATENRLKQSAVLGHVFARSPFQRDELAGYCERVIFSDPRSQRKIAQNDSYHTLQTSLTPDNLVDAVLASGSMPVYMHPVQHELSGQTHNLYDGGMLDYHPVPDLFWEKDDGLTLYPHFYDHIKLRWFDKFYPKRRANAALLDRTILIAPSAAFVRALPNQRIPSRQDFRHYKNDPETRTQNWLEVVKRSEALGAAFEEIISSDNIANHVNLLS